MWIIKSYAVLTIILFSIIYGNALTIHEDPLEYQEGKPLGPVVEIEQAVSEFEKTHQANIELPTFIPFKFTHSGGNYYPKDRTVLISYLNEKTGALMDVHVQKGNMPDRNKLRQTQKLIPIKAAMKVENNVAIYVNDFRRTEFKFIYFYKDGFEYRVAISRQPVEYDSRIYVKVVESFN